MVAKPSQISFTVRPTALGRSGTIDTQLIQMLEDAGLAPSDFQLSPALLNNELCWAFGTPINVIAVCCPGFTGFAGIPTLADLLGPMLEVHEVIVRERDFVIEFIRLEDTITRVIPIEDLEAAPEGAQQVSAEETFLDGQEVYDEVEVRFYDRQRNLQPNSVTSIDPNAPDTGRVQATFDYPVAMRPTEAAMLADRIRVRSQTERPFTFWTTPKNADLVVGDVVRVQYEQGEAVVRITNISNGPDGIIRMDGLTMAPDLMVPISDFITTGDPDSIPSQGEIESANA